MHRGHGPWIWAVAANVLCHADALLDNDGKTNYTTVVTRKRPVKSKNIVAFSVWSVPKYYEQDMLFSQSTNSIKASVVFLDPRANDKLVPKFHVALSASHAAPPFGDVKISP